MCSVFVRSVSPCRLVPEVRLFPSPPCAVFGRRPVVCPLFSSSCLSGFPRLCRVCVCVYRLNRRKTSSLYYIIYGRGQRDLQLWPLPTKLHTGDQVNVPACPALGAFKTQLGGQYIFRCCFILSLSTVIYIYISYINSAPV